MDEKLWTFALLILAYLLGLVPLGIIYPALTQLKLDIDFLWTIYMFSWPVALLLYFTVRSLTMKLCYRPSQKYIKLKDRAKLLEEESWKKTLEGDFQSDHSDLARLDKAMMEADMERQNSPFFKEFDQNKIRVLMMGGSTVVSSVVSSWILSEPGTMLDVTADITTILMVILGLSFLFYPMLKWRIPR